MRNEKKKPKKPSKTVQEYNADVRGRSEREVARMLTEAWA